MSAEQREYDVVVERIRNLNFKKKILTQVLKGEMDIPYELEAVEKRLVAESGNLRRAFARVTRPTRGANHE